MSAVAAPTIASNPSRRSARTWLALLGFEATILAIIAFTSTPRIWAVDAVVPFQWLFVVTHHFGLRWFAAWFVVILLRRRAVGEVLAAPHDEPDGSATRLLLVVHGVSFAALLVVFARLANGEPSRVWVGAGLVLGALSSGAGVGAYLASRLPFAVWRRLLSIVFIPALIGAVVLEVALAIATLGPRLWPSLGWLTLMLVGKMLGLFTSHVYLDVEHLKVGTRSFAVTIGPPCAGYEGIGLIVTFLTAYLVVFRQRLRFPRALWLLPIGVITIWVANAVRIALLVAIGALWSRSVALGGFHSQMGWIMVTAVACGVSAMSLRSSVFSDVATTPIARTHPSSPYLIPFIVLMCSLMISGALSSGFNYLYPIGVLAVGGALASYVRTYRSWSWSWSWPAVGIGALAWILWIVLEPAARVPAGPPKGLQGVAPWLVFAWIAFKIVGSAITVPLAEELAFRGFFLRRLQASDVREVPHGRFTWLSFVGSSVAFGLLHGRWLAGTLAGMLFAGALYRRRKLADAVIAHATANILIAAQVLATGRWSLWQ